MQAEGRVGEWEAQVFLSLDLIDTSLKLLAAILMGWHILSSEQERWRIGKLNNLSLECNSKPHQPESKAITISACPSCQALCQGSTPKDARI